MVNHSYIIVLIVYLYCHVKNRCTLIHFTCMVLYMCMCFVLVFIMVLYMCILSFVCLCYAFMYDTLLVGGNKEYLLFCTESIGKIVFLLSFCVKTFSVKTNVPNYVPSIRKTRILKRKTSLNCDFEVVTRNILHVLCGFPSYGPFVDLLFSSIGTQLGAKHPTSPLGHLFRKITKNIECFVVVVVWWFNVPVNSYGHVETVS